MTVKRIWHGWATPENAPKYEKLAKETVFPEIKAKNIPGYHGIELMRRAINNDEVEFMTIMTFDSIDNIIDFLGEDYTQCYVPDVVQKVLSRWDTVAAHYSVQ
jgi:antibiotic biosynthesis monooxygenase (ABM) superfamily enzyme